MKPIIIISRNIAKNKTISNKNVYLVTKEIHVRSGVCLTIQDGAQIYLLNGHVVGSKLKRAALLFDQGSNLRAKKFTMRAANIQGKPEKISDNGGVWFCGNYSTASKDGVSVKTNPKKRVSKFTALELRAHYLGRLDPLANKRSRNSNIQSSGDDIDGISLLGVGKKEWKIAGIKSYYSGDDGLDLTNSEIQLDRIYIKQPVEDGLNISSSRIQIRKNLSISMGNHGTDRDLFDLETDDGGSYIELCKGCNINIDGVFGDQLVLSSQDLPKIKKGKHRYQFTGRIKKSDSLIYSITMD